LGDALEAHNTAIKYGGLPGILNLSLVESAISRPYNGYYRPIRKKAAALIESVCRNHGFADGNKRTCLLLLVLLLDRSGYGLARRGGEDRNRATEDMLIKVARGEMNFAQIEEWIDVRLVKRPVSS
jgi:death-on-curing protein